MRSRAAARSATTTRRWASPPRARGKRSSAISARSAPTSRRRRSPSSASATCRATCSATACCCRSATKLVAAFDHRDIFLDPDPDLAVSFAERERMFDLPRSSWADYDQAKISKGGGVYSRSMKRIPLSPEVRALTGLAGEHAEPAELMQALLKAPVDLLWFGGIGTFIKASGESNADVGDKANDAVRVDGQATAREGRRRRRQSGLHASRAHRVRARRRAHQHRRDRQFGRRRYVRPRGQPQDPAQCLDRARAN